MDHLQTEARNPASTRLDELTSAELVSLMCAEDATIPAVVASQARPIAQAIDAIAAKLPQGGRLIYTGAGTSGRLGVLDASECPPTFQSPPDQVVGVIAGGRGAMFQAVEGAEDDPDQGAADLRALALTNRDVVVGIATSGRTPYVLGAVRYARSVGAFTIGLACTPQAELSELVDIPIVPVVGPEVVTGSTRLKAGTATKLVLNLLTTGAMVRMGKTFGNLMVDLKATNTKLRARANRIVRTVTGLSETEAADLLTRTDGEVKTAIVSHLTMTNPSEARARLAATNGRIGPALAGTRPTTTQTAATRPRRPDLILGIDGGGTSTIAMVARADNGEILGRAVAGPSNIQSVGVETALRALDDAIAHAFQSAGLQPATVAAAALGLAGVDRQEGLDVIHGWAGRVGLAERVAVSNDATLLLAAGTPEGWGLAVIAGTGSIAFVRTPEGTIGRCGGWGPTLGDEGSAFAIVSNALKAACRAYDQVGEPTQLVERFVHKMNLSGAPDLIPAVYRGAWDRAALAGLAPVVLQTAMDGDAVADQLVRAEATSLAQTAVGAVRNHRLPTRRLPLALAGGVLLGSELYQTYFLSALRELGLQPDPVTPVPDPAIGAVVLARRFLG